MRKNRNVFLESWLKARAARIFVTFRRTDGFSVAAETLVQIGQESSAADAEALGNHKRGQDFFIIRRKVSRLRAENGCAGNKIFRKISTHLLTVLTPNAMMVTVGT